MKLIKIDFYKSVLLQLITI